MRQRLMDWFTYQHARKNSTLVAFALFPSLCCLIGFVLEIMPTHIYTIYKGGLFLVPFLALRFRQEMRPSLPALLKGINHGLVLCVVPLLFLSLGGLSLLDAEALREKLMRLGILPIFIFAILFLSFINAFLEEWYFRGFLLQLGGPFADKRDQAIFVSLAFSLHHFIVLLCYFGVFWSLSLAACTAVAGYSWTRLRQKGESLFALFVSHCLCDLIILGIGGWLLIFNP